MNDQKTKNIAAQLLRKKDSIHQLLSYLQPSDIQQGILRLPDALVNVELRAFLLKWAAPYLTNYRLTSSPSYGNSGASGEKPGLLFLDMELYLKQLGKVQARYMISISQLTFCPENVGSRRLTFSYREDIKSMGNAFQSMGLKAFLGDRTLLMKAAELSGLSGRAISLNSQSGAVELSQLPCLIPSFLDHAALEYDSAEEGYLQFHFSFI